MVFRISSMLACVCGLLLTHASFAGDDKYADVRDTLATCVACHGENGVSKPPYPILAGQHLHYIYVQLKDFKSGFREGPIMGPIASALDKDQMLKIAEFFSEQSWPGHDYESDPAKTNIGLTVISAGQCVACHLGGFEGNSRVPRLAGQHLEYLNKTMSDFKHKRRNNSPSKGALFSSFSEEEVTGVSDYLAGLKP